jgi:hypothetical protein
MARVGCGEALDVGAGGRRGSERGFRITLDGDVNS